MKRTKQSYKDIIKLIGKKFESRNCYVYFTEEYGYIITNYCAIRSTPLYYNIIAADNPSLPLYENGKEYEYNGKRWMECFNAPKGIEKMFDYDMGDNLKHTGLTFKDDKIEARLFVNEENNKIVAFDETIFKAFEKAYLSYWFATDRKNIYAAESEEVTAILCPIYMIKLPEVLDEKYR